MVLLRGKDLEVPTMSGHFLRAGYFLSNAEVEARRAFQRALALDRGFARAASGLAELAVRIPTRTNLDPAHDELSRMHRRHPEDAGLWLEHADVAWLRGDRATAVLAGREALQRSGLHPRHMLSGPRCCSTTQHARRECASISPG